MKRYESHRGRVRVAWLVAAALTPVSADEGALESSAGRAGKILASGPGSHQFHRPNSATVAGTRSARTTVASSRMPAPSAVANTLMSVFGPEAREANALI